MRFVSKLLFWISCLSLVVSLPTYAQVGTVSGGIIVPVVDGDDSSCIDVTQQSVSVDLVALKVQRYADWLKSSKDVGAKFDVLISPPTGSSVPNFEFPEAISEQASGSGDILEVPVNGFSLLNNYVFADSKNDPYTHFGISFNFVNVTDNSVLSNAILNLVSFTKTVAVPTDPFSAGVGYFGSFFNQLISADQSSTDNDYLGYNGENLYRGIGTCKPTQLHEGTYAVIFNFITSGSIFKFANPPASGILDTSTISTGPGVPAEGTTNYCFFLHGGGQLTYAENNNDLDCAKDNSSQQVLNNPQIVIETVAYDLQKPPPATGSVSQVGIGSVSSSAITSLTWHDLADFPTASRPAARTALSDLQNGTSFNQTLLNLRTSAAPGEETSTVAVTSPGNFSGITVAKTEALALVNLRAASRCRNVGLPVSACVISNFAQQPGGS